MITLITAVPGGGKTCYAIGEMLKAQSEGRPIFAHGIPNLKIPHTPIYCFAESCEHCRSKGDLDPEKDLIAELWHVWAPKSAFIVMDEVQHIYRPRRQGQNIPQSVMAFETHRHRGIDFLIISQSPMLFDPNIRRLVGKHLHLKANWAGRQMYEWPECQEDPKRTGDAVKSKHNLDKKHFKLYKSSEMHTKVKRKIPVQVYIAFGALAVVLFLGYRMAGRASDAYSGDSVTVADQQGGLGPAAESAIAPGQAPEYTAAVNYFDRDPIYPMYPESAPAYSALIEVKTFPRVASCVLRQANASCRCYSQQATELDLTYLECKNWIDKRPFNPYLETDRRRTREASGPEQVTPEPSAD